MAYRIPEKYRVSPEKTSSGGGAAVSLRWLGAAAFEIEAAGAVLLVDPFVSRPPVSRLLPWRNIATDEAATARHFPRADLILVGHSHYDHLMDAPSIARRTGARLAGSPTTCNISESLGVEKGKLLVQSDPPEPFESGPFKVRFVPSLHGKALLGRAPYPGRIETPPPAPRRAGDYPSGRVYGLRFEAGGVSFYHLGSADLVDEELEGFGADVLLVGLDGRFHTPNYVERLLRALKPKVVVPCHYDWFFRPLERGLRLLPRIGMEEFFGEIERHAPEARILMPDLLEKVLLRPGDLG